MARRESTVLSPNFGLPKYGRGKKNVQALTSDEEKARAAALSAKEAEKVTNRFETRYTKHKTDTDELNGVIGPFDVTQSTTYPASSVRNYYRRRIWRRSKTKRYIAPNGFGMNVSETKYIKGTGTRVYWDAGSNNLIGIVASTQPNDAQASNKALSKFVSSVRDSKSAAAAVTLAEWHQSHNMIVTRATQLLKMARAVKSLRSGNISKAFAFESEFAKNQKSLRTTGLPRVKNTGRVATKSSANLWLEYHFGWSPLVQDIYNAVQVLSANPPTQLVKGRGVWTEPIRVITTGTQPSETIGDYRCFVECGAHVYVSNPNLALANQMGFINPATVAWELVPFSFLVDWFLPVGNWLDSFTDLLGYSVHYPYTTTKRVAIANYHYKDNTAANGPEAYSWGSACSVNRALSLPTFKLKTTPFKGFSAARGATAIALLVQQFLSMKAEPLVYSRHLR